jgi:hypothetical protein
MKPAIRNVQMDSGLYEVPGFGPGTRNTGRGGVQERTQWASNDYLMDRQAQKEGRTFSGVEGFAMQDASVQESMGPIQDRTRENLVPTDQGIIMARRRLIAAVQGLQKDKAPPGTDPRHQRVRSVSIILPQGVAFSEAAENALVPEPGSAHATV